ncbi:MAG: hypothetical protein WCV85_05265 [Patescibacteria group bacterium]|jgi:hypothetical protein
METALRTKPYTTLDAGQAGLLLQQLTETYNTLGSTARANVQALQTFFSQVAAIDSPEQGFLIGQYAKLQPIVDQGKMTNDFPETPAFTYAFVPLGLILKGEVVVRKGGKATKRLSTGDFLGLFETSDWLLTQRTRNIGDWTLVANEHTEILFFSAATLQSQGDFRVYLTELARNDRVPQPLTTLPLLDWVASHTTKSRLGDYLIIAHTHLLPNNEPLFRHLAHLVGFGRMFVLEKPYSTVRATYTNLVQAGCEVVQVRMEPGMPYEFAVQKSVEILWAKILEELGRSKAKNLLIVDDGGDIWLSLPWDKLANVRVAGVEQTQRGITRITSHGLRIPPIVSVASSGIKKLLESQFIGQSIVDKLLQEKILTPTTKIGILGMGSIGQAIAACLQKQNLSTQSYDASAAVGLKNTAASIDALLNDNEVVISTTGTDALKGIALERVAGNKILVSASSADVEFASILKLGLPTNEPFAARKVHVHAGFTLTVLNGGYPFNFDREKDATPSEDIVLTRSLMYIAAMQAVALIANGNGEGKIYAVDQVSQKHLLGQWLKEKASSKNPAPITAKDTNQIISYTGSPNIAATPSVWEE